MPNPNLNLNSVHILPLCPKIIDKDGFTSQYLLTIKVVHQGLVLTRIERNTHTETCTCAFDLKGYQSCCCTLAPWPVFVHCSKLDMNQSLCGPKAKSIRVGILFPSQLISLVCARIGWSQQFSGHGSWKSKIPTFIGRGSLMTKRIFWTLYIFCEL